MHQSIFKQYKVLKMAFCNRSIMPGRTVQHIIVMLDR